MEEMLTIKGSSSSTDSFNLTSRIHLVSLYLISTVGLISMIALAIIPFLGLSASHALWTYTAIFGALYGMGAAFILTDKQDIKIKAFQFLALTVISTLSIIFTSFGGINFFNPTIVLRSFAVIIWIPLLASSSYMGIKAHLSNKANGLFLSG